MKDHVNFIHIAQKVIEIEQKEIKNLKNRLDNGFVTACELVLNTVGHVVVVGMGKSGHIAKKITATFASTGTPAFFIHPAEACHGDLGMISSRDIIMAISYSGETEEILNLIPLIKHLKTPLIAMTGNTKSRLAQAATQVIDVSVDEEACPLGLAPTASTTASLVMGDAIAVALLRARGFNADDFARFHPSGALGKRLLMSVAELMHHHDDMPAVTPETSIADTLIEITQKRLGMTTIVDPDRKTLLGIFTDGDLRRTLDKQYDLHQTAIKTVMTQHCLTMTPAMLASEALSIMRSKQITALPVIDNHNVAVGVLHMHDLLKAGVV